jgi:hypothetical protein
VVVKVFDADLAVLTMLHILLHVMLAVSAPHLIRVLLHNFLLLPRRDPGTVFNIACRLRPFMVVFPGQFFFENSVQVALRNARVLENPRKKHKDIEDYTGFGS